MPTYEFRCPDGHTFDRFYRKISDAVAEVECPVCGKPATRQISGGSGLVFKGSGFYLTDYGKNAHRKGESSNGKSAGESASSASESKGESKTSESKSESKSETKSESKSSEPKGGSSSGGSGASSSSKSDK
jgi:putative FmdB family regulatory protein